MTTPKQTPNGVEVIRDLITPKPPVQNVKPGNLEYLVRDPKQPVRANEIPEKGQVIPTGFDLSGKDIEEIEHLNNLINGGSIGEYLPKAPEMPPELVGTMTQEKWEELVEVSYDSCEQLVLSMVDENNKINTILKTLNSEENKKFLPYINPNEARDFCDLMKLALEDRDYIHKSLMDIRSSYEVNMDKETGKQNIPLQDMTLTDAQRVGNIKENLDILAKQMTNLLEPTRQWINDFYAMMKLRYYSAHLDEAPEEVKEYMAKHGFIQTVSFNFIQPESNPEAEAS